MANESAEVEPPHAPPVALVPIRPRMCLAASGSLPRDPAKRATLLLSNKWQNRDIRVSFLAGTPLLQERVLAAARTWSNHAEIEFLSSTSEDAEIRVDFEPGGSWSWVGTQALTIPAGLRTMNFGWIDESSSEKELRRVVLHEFGHALGLIHEHQHPKAGIPWNKEKVYAAYAGSPNFWERAEVDANLFATFSQDETQFSEVDPDSIMMYPIDPALLMDPAFAVGENDDLSETDRAFIRKMYR